MLRRPIEQSGSEMEMEVKTTIDYSKSPAKAFDAVEDLKDYFAERWDEVSKLMSSVKNVQHFQCYAGFAGVEGYPVEAWYDLYNGEGSYRKELRRRTSDGIS